MATKTSAPNPKSPASAGPTSFSLGNREAAAPLKQPSAGGFQGIKADCDPEKGTSPSLTSG